MEVGFELTNGEEGGVTEGLFDGLLDGALEEGEGPKVEVGKGVVVGTMVVEEVADGDGKRLTVGEEVREGVGVGVGVAARFSTAYRAAFMIMPLFLSLNMGIVCPFSLLPS